MGKCSEIVLDERSSIQIESIGTFWPPRIILGLRGLEHFGLKNKTRKIVKIHKDFEL